MKKLLTLLVFFIGCETFDVVADNPLDPSNPDYVKPTISILSPSDQQTINTDKVKIILQGNELVSEYRYKIVTTDSYKGTHWSSWSPSNEVSLEYLNEYTYTVIAQSRYLNEETSDEASATFTIDALPPSSLLLYPKYVETSTNTIFNIFLFAHDLSNVSALDFIIQYDDTKLSFTPEEGSEEYGDVNIVRSISNNQVHYTLGKYGDNGFEENDIIAKISFRVSSGSGSYSDIKISSITAKSLDGQTIEIDGSNQVRVDVK